NITAHNWITLRPIRTIHGVTYPERYQQSSCLDSCRIRSAKQQKRPSYKGKIRAPSSVPLLEKKKRPSCKGKTQALSSVPLIEKKPSLTHSL
ncbi:hypothetical protein P7L97_24080, partial [Vibrio parahaemolyticus]|nr:hypothetical protein [Vibrio parahaemolyticus]